MRSRISMVVCLLVLTACGGGDGGGSTPPPAPPAAPAPPPVIGADGGTVTESSGASIDIPAGAFTENTTIRIARDSTGAPALPGGLAAAGNMYVITPHGGDFAEGVTVRLPAPSVTLQPNQEFKIAKAQPGGEWIVLEDTALEAGVLSTKVGSFSFFQVVVVTYLLPIAQVPPLQVSTFITCDPQCTSLYGPVTATYTVTSNGGQTSDNCPNAEWAIFAHPTNIYYTTVGSGRRAVIPAGGGSFTMTIEPGLYNTYRFGVGRKCSTYGSYSRFGFDHERSVVWVSGAIYPSVSIQSQLFPAQLDVVEGLMANVDAVLTGGASQLINSAYTVPTRLNRAVIEWERSGDSGNSWSVVARSFQDEANPLPGGVGIPWRAWSVRHGFVAKATDQGAMIRLRACYTPPTEPAAPCQTSRPVLINVLQQSGVPTITSAPRSVLVRTGQTASFSVTAAGVPAPTLQWQTRAANSTDGWTYVTAGIGATTANYTTAPNELSGNGVQFRVVATNAVSSAASIGVTVSVSDLEVAPSISTQPAALSVAAGSDAVFAVDARGTEALSYQWSRNGAAIAGANSPVLRLTGVSVANAGNYAVSISNGAGSVASNAATLTITAGTPAAVAPSIVNQPASVVANVGATATFAVGLNGSGPFTFQWRREGANIAGATSAVYTINSVALPNAGAYSVIVSNSAGSVTSSNAVLDVTTSSAALAPSITSQPATVIIPALGSGTIAVGATGSGPLFYQWYRNGELLSGATLPVLLFRNLTEVELGSYVVTITNSVSTVTSQAAQVIMLGAPVIVQQPADATVPEGEIATFFVVADSSGLRYQWSVNGTPLPGYTAATLRTDPLVPADSGAVYSVAVYNSAGLVYSRGAILTVQAASTPVTTPTLVSRALAGGPPDNTSQQPSISADGRYVAFISLGTNLSTDSANSGNAYVRDMVTGNTTLINYNKDGNGSSQGVFNVKISSNGRYAIFSSRAGDLVPGDTNNGMDIFRRDLVTGTNERLSVYPNGDELELGAGGNGDYQLDISADGRFVIFLCAFNIAGGPSNNDYYYLFYRDLQSGETRRIAGSSEYSVAYSALSDDGLYAAYALGVSSGTQSIQLYDIEADSHSNVFSFPLSTPSTGLWQGMSISSDGRYTAFSIVAPDLLGSERSQVIVADRNLHTYAVASVNLGVVGNGNSGYPEISGDGRYVTFSTIAPSLTNNLATSSEPYLVVHDLVALKTSIASVRSNGTAAPSGLFVNEQHALSEDGSTLAFVADYDVIAGGMFGSQVFAASRP